MALVYKILFLVIYGACAFYASWLILGLPISIGERLFLLFAAEGVIWIFAMLLSIIAIEP